MILIYHIRIKTKKFLEKTRNDELFKLYNSLTVNKLTLNAKKSNYVIFRPYQKWLSNNISIKFFDNKLNAFVSIEQKSCVKYLGVYFDLNLSWRFHINLIYSKISETVGHGIRQIKTLCTTHDFINTIQLFNIALYLFWSECLGTGCKIPSRQATCIDMAFDSKRPSTVGKFDRVRWPRVEIIDRNFPTVCNLCWQFQANFLRDGFKDVFQSMYQ